jgi:photosystem II stability/assembly factor-like uncharacterized protein
MRKKVCFGLLICSLTAMILAGCGQQGTTPVSTPTPTVQASATTGGTASPTPTPTPGPYHPINAIRMSDATTGWALTTTKGQILHTSDGGNTWQDVTPPYPSGSPGEVPPAFDPLNGNMAWVAVFGPHQPNVVFRTSDGGQSWQEAMLPTSSLGVTQVQFVNAQDGWVFASFGGLAAGSEGVDLFGSTDGGQTWSLVARAPGALPLQGIKSGMSWISATTGWVTGIIYRENTVYLYRSQDGGMSWQSQSLPLPSGQATITTQPPVFFSATERV